MKIILGINALHSDSSACIIKNGELVCALEEERLNRKKHTAQFPILAIEECIKIAGINKNYITDIAINNNPKSNILPKLFFTLKNIKIQKNNEFIKRFKNKINLKKVICDKLNIKRNIKFHNIEHHLSHIASAYFPSNFNKTNALSIDGSGDFVSLAIGECNDQKIKITNKIYFPDSLGIFYQAMTQFLGFKNYGDEYKIMGLAPYGKPIYFDKIKNNIFKETKNFFELNQKFFNHSNISFNYQNNLLEVINDIYNKKIIYLFKDDMENEDNLESFKKNFASSTQKIFQFFFQKILNYISEKNYSTNLVYAGGCALNSSANKSLIYNKNFDNIYIPYAPSDNGGSIGAALLVNSKYYKNCKDNTNPYLGPSFKNHEVSERIYKEKFKQLIKITKLADDNVACSKAADLLASGNVIGWFQGKMEFGPRALGNRSILADPRNPNMKNIINSKIKRRENFRPFAPSVIDKFQKDWFDGNYQNLYMSSVMNVKESKKKVIPAVTHTDGTARVQTVSREVNKKFYLLLSKFHYITGVPILLNTSFNENEPIVCTPEEAVECLLRSDLDGLFIENFFITKNHRR
jgi:carbamoyltransferase